MVSDIRFLFFGIYYRVRIIDILIGNVDVLVYVFYRNKLDMW